jgi:hypothetical protein
MLTVLPVADKGVSYGIWVLESLVKRYEDKVVSIIQIGGEVDEKHPTSAATFIVVMMDGFTFTAFVSDRGSMPKREDYSGTGSSYYERFRKFVLDFQGEVIGVPGLNVSNDRGVNQYGIHAKCMGFSWDEFYNAISEDLGFKDGTNAEVREKFFSLTTVQKMEAYRIFLVNAFFTHLWEVIPVTRP